MRKNLFFSSLIKKLQIAGSANLRKNTSRYFCFSLICVAVFLTTNASGVILNSLSDTSSPNNVALDYTPSLQMLDSLARLIYRATLIVKLKEGSNMAPYDKGGFSEISTILKKTKANLLEVHNVSVALYKPDKNSDWTLAVASNIDLDPSLFKNIIEKLVLDSSHNFFDTSGVSKLEGICEKQQKRLKSEKEDLEEFKNGDDPKYQTLCKNIQRDIDMAKLAIFLNEKFEKDTIKYDIQSALKNKRIKFVEDKREMHSELKLIEFLNRQEYPHLRYQKLARTKDNYVKFQYIGNDMLNCKKCHILIKGESKEEKEKSSIIGFNEFPDIFKKSEREYVLMHKGKSKFVVFTQGYYDSGYPEMFIPDWSLKCNELKIDEKYIQGRLNSLSFPSQKIPPNELCLRQTKFID